MFASRFFIILGFILIAIASRLLPHPPNFTSLNAIALFGAVYLGSRWLSLVAVLLSLLLSDAILGFHSTMFYVYLSFGITILMGDKLKKFLSFKHLPYISFASSFVFFLVANFGVWMTGSLYPKTIVGLELCYLAALPFLTYQVLGDLVYGALFMGGLYLSKYVLKRKSHFPASP